MNISHRLQQSLKFRLFRSYCNVFRVVKSGKLPRIDWKPLDKTLPRLVTIVYPADIPLLVYSLRSLMRYGKTRPPLWIIGDSDNAYEALQEVFGDRTPEGLELWHWETLLQQLEPRYQKFIKTWENSGKWGVYSRKFAVTLAANSTADILISDADVLWHGNFLETLQSLRTANPGIYAGKDYGRAYDEQVADFLAEPRIFQDEALNCGVVYYPQQDLLEQITPELVTDLLPYAAKATNHLEQTLVAYAFWQSGGKWFDRDVLATTMIDDLKLTNQVRSLGRHYAGGKHMFWRDA